MKKLPAIASILLALCFLAASVPFLLNLVKMPPVPEGTPMSAYMAAMIPTGYMKFVKVFELVGALMLFTRAGVVSTSEWPSRRARCLRA